MFSWFKLISFKNNVCAMLRNVIQCKKKCLHNLNLFSNKQMNMTFKKCSWVFQKNSWHLKNVNTMKTIYSTIQYNVYLMLKNYLYNVKMFFLQKKCTILNKCPQSYKKSCTIQNNNHHIFEKVLKKQCIMFVYFF